MWNLFLFNILSGQPGDLICGINRMFSDVATHTWTHKLTTSRRLWLSVCLSKPIHCLCRPTFICRSKELISIWLKGLAIASCTVKFLGLLLFQVPRLFISLFLLQWGGLVRSGSPAISPRCTLPSCCFALIKKLLDKRRGCTGSMVRKQHSSHWGTAPHGNSCRLALSEPHFCYVRHYAF